MEINAIVYLEYWDGESISGGRERLDLYVKFKEEGKFFKTKLREILVSVDQITNSHRYEDVIQFDDYNQYCDYVENILNNIDFIKEVAENMIKEYFEYKCKVDNKEERRKEISDKVSKLDKINIKVKIK